MNIRSVKFLDELFGPPICLILDVYNTFKKIFIKARLLPVNKILIIKFFGMGSILTMGPMIRALKAKFPNAKIDIFTFNGNKEICRLTNLFDRIITINTSSIIWIIWEFLTKILKLRKEKYDVVIDAEFFAKSSTVISYLSGGRNRIGFFLMHTGILLKMMWRGNLLTHEVFYNAHKHIKIVFLALANAIGADTKNLDYAPIHIPRSSRKKARDILGKYTTQGDKLFLMNINSGPLCFERRWPGEKFAQLCEYILKQDDVKIILVGSKQDVTYTEQFLNICNSLKGLINMTGELDVSILAALMEKSDLFISNDSGPLHIAVSLGTPTVSFFGPETPVKYGPGAGKHYTFYAGVYCSPCLNTYNQKTAPCNGNNICMHRIAAEDVYKVISEKYLR
jgi:ADP-heptose:LPS heptosyltransferase